MEIRRATPSDIPELTRLLIQVCNVHQDIRPELFKRDGVKYNEAELLKILQDDTSPIYCAVEDHRFLGYCFCQLREYKDSTVATDRKECYIDDLCIDENTRGKGVATALYHHIMNAAKAMGCHFITLNVWCGNENAMAFYQKMGLMPRSITMDIPLEDIKC